MARDALFCALSTYAAAAELVSFVYMNKHFVGRHASDRVEGELEQRRPLRRSG